jgi:hypothetical protein
LAGISIAPLHVEKFGREQVDPSTLKPVRATFPNLVLRSADPLRIVAVAVLENRGVLVILPHIEPEVVPNGRSASAGKNAN